MLPAGSIRPLRRPLRPGSRGRGRSPGRRGRGRSARHLRWRCAVTFHDRTLETGSSCQSTTEQRACPRPRHQQSVRSGGNARFGACMARTASQDLRSPGSVAAFPAPSRIPDVNERAERYWSCWTGQQDARIPREQSRRAIARAERCGWPRSLGGRSPFIRCTGSSPWQPCSSARSGSCGASFSTLSAPCLIRYRQPPRGSAPRLGSVAGDRAAPPRSRGREGLANRRAGRGARGPPASPGAGSPSRLRDGHISAARRPGNARGAAGLMSTESLRAPRGCLVRLSRWRDTRAAPGRGQG